MTIRTVKAEDTEDFYKMMCRLDEETKYMMYEPGERQHKANNIEKLRATLKAASKGEDFLKVAVNECEEIVGYLWAQRGNCNRILHTAYIVTGILADYRGQGIGTEFFRLLDEWAKEKNIVRLELTVECCNFGARKLYEKNGFRVEGIRPKSMLVDGEYIDEYYMGKVF